MMFMTLLPLKSIKRSLGILLRVKFAIRCPRNDSPPAISARANLYDTFATAADL